MRHSLLCCPGWCVHKSDVQNKWDGNILYTSICITHTDEYAGVCSRPQRFIISTAVVTINAVLAILYTILVYGTQFSRDRGCR